ncbi:oligosaccharide flippase family protein [Panacibacter ginsenosidivorans]|uniref:Oligosaccharide flippase family protein n=1 Tax=Panacibacter ginsenosidivorans TaxID=1813871 RepID=A0A5B8V6A7_9BACT|nr:oligosaccharide flippase family protein [Panacibacter ginsenosidivorans]QEC66635.1 oligosaccharide flippase family protein [Panacibacter ginsenosidivorans]
MLSNIREKLQNKHFLSLAGNGIMSILGMITIALLYRVLSLSDIGVWVFFQSTVLLVDTFRSGFLTTAFIKFYAGSSKKRSAEVAGSTWYIALCITGILVAINLPAYFFLQKIGDPGLAMFFKWFGITYIFTLPSFVATCVLQGQQRFDRLLYIRFISQGSFIILVIILMFMHRVSLQSIAYAYLGSSLLTSAVAIITGWSRINTFIKRSTSCIKEIFHFGKYSVGTTLSSNLFRSSDTFIINFMLGAPALAVYNIGQRLMEIVEIPLRSFAATGMPVLSAAYNSNDSKEVIAVLKKYAGMLTVALIPAFIGAVLFANIAVAVIGGGQYAGTEAANVLRIFMTFALLYPADRFFALTIDVIHKPKINFYKVLIMLTGNILADFAGIWFFGNIYGVALATVVPILIGVLIGNWALQQYQPFQFFSIFSTGYQEVLHLVKQVLPKKRKAFS